jgi:hypothetical protein
MHEAMNHLQPVGQLTLLAAACTPELKEIGRRFVKDTRQRYIDPVAELGVIALHLAVARLGGRDALPEDQFRRALFVVTARGPQATRLKLQTGYANDSQGAVSATIFSNCGYNIAGALMARSQSIRGPVLTFGETPSWRRDVPKMAQAFLERDRVDWLALVFLDEQRAEISWYGRSIHMHPSVDLAIGEGVPS